jgi:hypothetical protein
LNRQPDEYNGWQLNIRAPAVGDLGTIVDVLPAPGQPPKFVVESCASDGATIWLGDFAADELEAISDAELLAEKEGRP